VVTEVSPDSGKRYIVNGYCQLASDRTQKRAYEVDQPEYDRVMKEYAEQHRMPEFDPRPGSEAIGSLYPRPVQREWSA
jgi:hypothetical protein